MPGPNCHINFEFPSGNIMHWMFTCDTTNAAKFQVLIGPYKKFHSWRLNKIQAVKPRT